MTTYIKRRMRLMAVLATSLTALSLSTAASAGNYIAPQTAVNPGASQPFNPARIDPVLYAHQVVGNAYRVGGQTYYPAHNPRFDETGTVSWYGVKFQGKLTASGERFDKNAMTAAHKTLPINSLVFVTNVATGQSVIVRINDRGPFIGASVIDLSSAAAAALGFKSRPGHVRVQYAGPAIPARTASHAAPINAAPPASQSLLPQISLPQGQTEIPQAYQGQAAGDDPTTVLTIKGPIHNA